MKRTGLIRKLEEVGRVLIRHGGKHDWYRNQKSAFHSLCLALEKSGNSAKHILRKLEAHSEYATLLERGLYQSGFLILVLAAQEQENGSIRWKKESRSQSHTNYLA